jgi:hypothetical protein
MTPADYETDFSSAASRAEFAEFLGKARSVVEIPRAVGEGWKTFGPERDALYAKVGAAIAEGSQILIALWDNLPARGLGGTADVVGWFQQGQAPGAYSLRADATPEAPPAPGLLVNINPLEGADKDTIKRVGLRRLRPIPIPIRT